MSRDVISVAADAAPNLARQLLLDTGVRLLPVLDDDGRPLGGVGLRELARPGETVAELMAALLTIGHRHAAMVVDPGSGKLVGLVTQADLLAALAPLSLDEETVLR